MLHVESQSADHSGIYPFYSVRAVAPTWDSLFLIPEAASETEKSADKTSADVLFIVYEDVLK